MRAYYYYCKKCGWKHELSQSKCPFCGSEVFIYDCHVYNFSDLTEKEQTQVFKAIQEIVENSPEFDVKAQEKRVVEQDKLNKYYAEKFSTKRNQVPQISCPYCHSTSIQKISMGSRIISSELFGLGSSYIGKQWHCKTCGSDF